MINHNYYVYILSNKHRSVYYTGVSNNLYRRLYEHEHESKKSFCGRYNCYDLVFYEWHQSIKDAIDREKQIKRWRREKKTNLIKMNNPFMRRLNGMVEYE